MRPWRRRRSSSTLDVKERIRQVLRLLALGSSAKEVAAQLAISVKTVETHRRKILLKLGLSNIAELTKYALREGLTLL